MARNPRAKAQRETARFVRERATAKRQHTPLPSRAATPTTRAASKGAQASQASDWVAGRSEPKGSLERKQAARMAALADQGKVDPKFLSLQKYWYHKKLDDKNEADAESESDYESAEDEDEDELCN